MDLHYRIPPPLQFIHLDIWTYTTRSHPHCSSFILIYGLTLSDSTPTAGSFILIYGLTLSDPTPIAVHSSWYMDLHYRIPPPLQFIHLDIWTYTIRSHPHCSSFILIYGLTLPDPTPTAVHSSWYMDLHYQIPPPLQVHSSWYMDLHYQIPPPLQIHSSWYMDLHHQILPPLQFIHLDIWTYTIRSHPRCSSFILIYGLTLSDPTPTAGSFILIYGLTLSDPTPPAGSFILIYGLTLSDPTPTAVHSSWYMDLHYQIPPPLQFIHLDIWTYTIRSHPHCRFIHLDIWTYTIRSHPHCRFIHLDIWTYTIRSHPRCSSFILIYGLTLSDPTPAAVHSSWYMDLHYQIPPPLQFIHLNIWTYTIGFHPRCSSFILIYGLTLPDPTPTAVHSSWYMDLHYRIPPPLQVHSSWYMDLHYQIPPPLQFIHLDIWTYTIGFHPRCSSFILIYGLTLSDPTPTAVHSSWYMDLHYQIPPPLQFIHLDIWTYTIRSHPHCRFIHLDIWTYTIRSHPHCRFIHLDIWTYTIRSYPLCSSFILIYGLTLSDPTPAAVHSSWYMDLHYQIPPPLQVHSSWYMDLHYQIPPPLQVHSSWYMDLHYQIPPPLQFIHLDIWTYTIRSHPRCSSFILIYGLTLSDPTPTAGSFILIYGLTLSDPTPTAGSFILIYGLTLSDPTPAAVHSSWYMDLHYQIPPPLQVHSSWYMDLHYQIPPPLQFIHLDIWAYTIRSHPRCSSFILIYGLTPSDPTPTAGSFILIYILHSWAQVELVEGSRQHNVLIYTKRYNSMIWSLLGFQKLFVKPSVSQSLKRTVRYCFQVDKFWFSRINMLQWLPASACYVWSRSMDKCSISLDPLLDKCCTSWTPSWMKLGILGQSRES